MEQLVQAAGILGKLLGSCICKAALATLWQVEDYRSTTIPRLLQAIRLGGRALKFSSA